MVCLACHLPYSLSINIICDVWVLIHKPRHHTAASSSARRATVTAWRCALHWVKIRNAVYVWLFAWVNMAVNIFDMLIVVCILKDLFLLNRLCLLPRLYCPYYCRSRIPVVLSLVYLLRFFDVLLRHSLA